ncbi:MAG: phospholipase D-like domain-containing protein [Pseudomonadota bacterium]
MRFIGLEPAGQLLRTLNAECLPGCDEVLAAIPYAERGHPDILLFDDCLRNGVPLSFYGRSDGTCPIAPEVLSWLLQHETKGMRCRLVRHYLHAKVIWWVGRGAYIGSANLTDRAWNRNYEAGIFLTDDELDMDGVSVRLRQFFDQIEEDSFPLTQEECQRQRELQKKRADLQKQLYRLQATFERDHPNLKDDASPITHQPARASLDRRRRDFVNEWNETLQLIRSIAALASSDRYRPEWIAPTVPAGVQGDQFLHAYYYQRVDPHSERDAYLRDHERNRKTPESALEQALLWWKSGGYSHTHEERTIYVHAPRFRERFAEDRILALSEDEWAETLGGSYAFGDHTTKMPNALLGLGNEPGGARKIDTHARMLHKTRSVSGRHSAPETFRHVLWGPGDAAERIFQFANDPDYKIPHIGPNILGEILGWVRPDEFPPRNTRTNKALIALGRRVKAFV